MRFKIKYGGPPPCHNQGEKTDKRFLRKTLCHPYGAPLGYYTPYSLSMQDADGNRVMIPAGHTERARVVGPLPYPYWFAAAVTGGRQKPPLCKGRGAGYHLKCNTQNKKRQYTNQGVKCSYYTTRDTGGLYIVLHTFYTERKKISTTTFVGRPQYAKNCSHSGTQPLYHQP